MIRALAFIACLLMAAGCAAGARVEQVDARTIALAHDASPLGGGGDAMRTLLRSAAAETVARGFSHFRFLPPEPGGRGVRVRLLNVGEVPDGAVEIWSAAEILAAAAAAER